MGEEVLDVLWTTPQQTAERLCAEHTHLVTSTSTRASYRRLVGEGIDDVVEENQGR